MTMNKSSTAKPSQKKEVAAGAREASRAVSPFDEMERIFEGFYPRGWLRPFRWDLPSWGDLAAPFGGRFPRVDVVDQEDKIVVKAEVPGVSKENLEVTLTDNTVTIKGSSEHKEEEAKGDYHRREISRGSFSRTIALPADVDGHRAKAKFKDGELELTLPKVAQAKRHSVKIES